MTRVSNDMGNSSLPARREAEAWFARLMAPDCTAAERGAFERWRSTTPVNAQAYADTECLWESLEGLELDEVIRPYAEAALETESETITARSAAVRSSTQRRRWKLPAALVAGVVACVLGLRLMLPSFFEPDAQLYRSNGRPQTVLLADGSRVQMDVRTRIDVRMASRRREVTLLQGRAIFDVAHDAARAFIVDTDHGFVTALGTRFQVDSEAGQVAVTLIEGSVSIRGQNGASEIRLAPGEQARYLPPHGQWVRRSVDTMAATSWSRGFHVFSATPLAEAVREINRYASVKLRIADPSLETLVLSGNFKTGDAENIAGALPVILPVEVKKAGGEIVVTRR